jgi:hypothetical protein
MTEQIVQASTGIPPIQYQDYPVDIRLRVYPTGRRYDLEIQAEGQMLRRPIEVSPEDLEALNKQLQEKMEAVATETIEGYEPTASEIEAQIRSLAEAGGYAFRRVFSHPDALEAIQTLVTQGQRVSIEVTTEDFFLPWELMYPAALNEPLSYDHFWGMNYIVSRVIAKGTRSGAFVSPTIFVDAPPKVGLLTYSGLPNVIEKEIPFFQSLADDNQIVLVSLSALNPDNRVEELQRYRSFWENAFSLAHFACHAFYEDGSPDESSILLSDEFEVRLMDMVNFDIAIYGHPLIIINACETGNLNPLYTSYFAHAFLQYGARGVVATECTVPDGFAADFAEHLYTRLLTGERLGESLLATRRFFQERHHNPTALLYSMYAPPSIRLVKVRSSE